MCKVQQIIHMQCRGCVCMVSSDSRCVSAVCVRVVQLNCVKVQCMLWQVEFITA